MWKPIMMSDPVSETAGCMEITYGIRVGRQSGGQLAELHFRPQTSGEPREKWVFDI